MQKPSVFRRLGARLVDMLILVPVWGATTAASFLLPNPALGLALSLVGLVIAFVYEGYFLAKQGYTPGKKLLKVRVVAADGGPLTPNVAWKRVCFSYGFTAAASIIGTVAGLVGVLKGNVQAANAQNALQQAALLWAPVLWFTWLLNLVAFVNLVLILVRNDRRAGHDLFAGTMVAPL